jgi:hypothetical protein
MAQRIFWLVFLLAGCSSGGNGGTDAGDDGGGGCEDCIEGLGVSKADLVSFLGGREGILVWVDAGSRIRVLDFREDDPQVRLLSEDLDCINPLIAPDGTRVVYSQGMANTVKSIHVGALSGGDSQQIAIGDVGYWHFSGGQEHIVYCDWAEKQTDGEGGSTYRQKLVTGGVAPEGDYIAIHDRAMDAGPNADLTWVGQVYEHLWAHNLQTGTDYPTEKFFLMDQGVADHQSCNGSMAPDGSGRLMCLVIPHDFVRVYTHDTQSDSFKQTSEFRLPADMAEWEFSEWSTHPDYFTAILRGSNLKNRLFIVKMAEGDLVPERLEISGEQTGQTYSHLYLEP